VDIELARAEFRDSPLYRNLIVGQDLRASVLQVNFIHDKARQDLQSRRSELMDKKRAKAITPEEEAELAQVSARWQIHRTLTRAERHQDIAEIRAIIDKYRKEARLHLGGVPMIVDDIIEFIKNDLRVFGLGMLCFLVGSLGIIFRMKRWVLLPMLSCAFVVIVMTGLLGMTGWEVTVVSSNFISLLLVFTMELSIYLIVRYRELRAQAPDKDHRHLVRETVQSMFIPCLYCVSTTQAGFLSLAVCDILPVVNFGYMMTLGLAANFTVVFLFFPAALMLVKRAPIVVEKEFGRAITGFFARMAEYRRAPILAASLALALFTWAGITRLQVENSFINYFKQSTEISKGMKFIDQELGGTTPLEIIVSFKQEERGITRGSVTEPSGEGMPPPDVVGGRPASEDLGAVEFDEFGEFEKKEEDRSKYWFTEGKLEKINKIQEYLEGLPAAGKVQSLATLWRIGRDINGGKPLDNFMLQLLFGQMPDDFKEIMVRPYAWVENDEARITMRVKDSLPELRRDAMIKQVRKDLVEKVGLKEGQFRLTGLMVLYNNMLQSLYTSQISTIGWSFLMLSLMFLALFRSFKIAFIAMFPNMLSCMTVLGVMGLSGIPLDVMTITIVSIGMGVAVDSTIQYLYRFRWEVELDHDYAKTMHRCHDSIGNAMFYTCGTMVAGYSILALSNFVPSILFGLLSALALCISLLGALCLLPVLVIFFKPFGPGK
jgi:predicted RND superfamily exporter protein